MKKNSKKDKPSQQEEANSPERTWGTDLIERDKLCARWNRTDSELKIIQFYQQMITYDADKKSLYPKLNFVFDKLNPFKKDYNSLPKEVTDHFKGLYDTIYKRVKYFDLIEVEAYDQDYGERTRKKKSRGSGAQHAAACTTVCREEADRLWDLKLVPGEPEITIKDMILRLRGSYPKETKHLDSSIPYVDNTIRGWIRDLCPNRKGGRRPKIVI